LSQQYEEAALMTHRQVNREPHQNSPERTDSLTLESHSKQDKRKQSNSPLP